MFLENVYINFNKKLEINTIYSYKIIMSKSSIAKNKDSIAIKLPYNTYTEVTKAPAVLLKTSFVFINNFIISAIKLYNFEFMELLIFAVFFRNSSKLPQRVLSAGISVLSNQLPFT